MWILINKFMFSFESVIFLTRSTKFTFILLLMIEFSLIIIIFSSSLLNWYLIMRYLKCIILYYYILILLLNAIWLILIAVLILSISFYPSVKIPKLRVFPRDLPLQDPVCVTQYFRGYDNPRNLATYTPEKIFQLPVRHFHCRGGYRP